VAAKFLFATLSEIIMADLTKTTDRRTPAVQEIPSLGRRVLAFLGWILFSGMGIWVLIVTHSARAQQLTRLAIIHENTLDALGLSIQTLVIYLQSLDLFVFTCFTAAALFLAVRKGTEPYTLLVSATLILVSVGVSRPFSILPAAPLNTWFWVSLVAACATSGIIFIMHTFPTGTFTSPFLRWVVFFWIGASFVWYLHHWLPGVEKTVIGVEPWYLVLGWVATGVLSAAYRFRRVFDTTQRQQTKWVIFGFTGAASAYFSYLYLVPLFFPQVNFAGPYQLLYQTVGWLFFYLVILLFPASLVASILRYRLWDVDFIIRRTIIYSLVMTVLTLVYFGLISLLQQAIYRPLNSPPVLAVAFSTMVVSFMFTPVRRSIHRFVDRRFYRARYDQTRALNELSDSLRHRVDLDEIAEEILRFVRGVLHPALLCLWLYPPKDSAASAETEHNGFCAPISPDEDPRFLNILQSYSRPVSVEEMPLESITADRLQSEGYVLTVPLVSQGELVGALNLGPRLSDQGYGSTDRELLATLATQTAPALRAAQLARLQRQAALEQQLIDTEMRVARDIQRTLLPKEYPAMPGWQVASHYQPARALGGDFFDMFSLQDGRIGLVMGDVSSKGTPAALVMASTRSLIRTMAQAWHTPGDVLYHVNELLVGDIPQGMYVTCLYAVLDPQSGEMVFANAGHNVPYVAYYGGISRELRARGMPLGLMPEMDYEEKKTVLEPGEWVLLYSDGLVEARNPAGELYSALRLSNLLPELPDWQSAIPGLLNSLELFTGEHHEQEDDITLLVVQRLPK
jgi:serine phosphatase RsbU (regulator of sigma subunit)